MAEIKYQDLTIDTDDVFEKTIRVEGGVPTDWTTNDGQKFDHVNVTVSEPYIKDKSFGRGTTNYRFGEAKDISKFLEHKPPFTVKAKMFTATDKNGKSVGIILDIDFSTVQEKELVDRQTKKSVPGATVSPMTPSKA